jgi:Nuclease-related domain
MKFLHQSSSLREQFHNQVAQRKTVSRNKMVEGSIFKGTLLEGFVPIVHEIHQAQNSFKGAFGESVVSSLLSSLPDTWTCFPNALIPVGQKVTEVDLLIVSLNGVFLVEVKTWTGSFAAYRDNWKRRQGSTWIPLEGSPTHQSLYHQGCFYRWIRSLVHGLPNDFVQSPVVFPSAKWIGAKECGVPVLEGIDKLKAFMLRSPEVLSLNQVGQIIEAVSQP